MFCKWDWPNIISKEWLSCPGSFRAGQNKDLTKPETAYEKTLAPMVVNIIVKVQEISNQSTTVVYNMHDMLFLI